ncbi:MAG: 5'-methylthioadenosine/adenosylhomocysteine nucleosidase [Oscillospiraceae bacterium]|nr:5'-methylthioadenosine/adenosylhomocysteine nucleosidase [Oscillospiraceae bacterium]
MIKLGIIGAMDLEVDALKEKLVGTKVTTKAGMDFYEGKLGGTDVVIVRCGIGKVNAALCVQILADLFRVSHVINTGIAGSLNAKLDIGDILVSRDAIHHDMDVTIFGYAPGQVPGTAVREFTADADMAALALRLCEKVNPDIHAMAGRVVSGDQFISSSEVKNRLISEFAGDCAEMEGASIAHGATLNGIPFVIIRAISDKADGSAEMDYPTFERQAALHSAKLVEAIAANM